MVISRKPFVLAILVLASALIVEATSYGDDKFGTFDIQDPEFGHPLLKYLNKSQKEEVLPFILSEYFYKDKSNIRQRRGSSFQPASASYRRYGSSFGSASAYKNADALLTKRFTSGELVVQLRQKAEVVIVLQFRNKLDSFKLKSPRLASGSCKGWEMVGGVEVNDGPAAHFFENNVERTGIAIKKRLGNSNSISDGLYEIEIPNMNQIEIENVGKPHTYIVLFVDPDTGKAFPYTPTPATLGLKNHIRPHTKCPSQLHNLWTTESEDDQNPAMFVGGIVGGTKIKFPTWHPLIDPVFYCSYEHDHGSYPGRYQPVFRKMVENSSKQEKDFGEGFKVFTMFEKNTDNGRDEWLHWIITVRMDLNDGKRFSERYHTVHLAIFDKDFRNVMMKLSVLNDYGFAGTRTNKGDEPLNSVMKKIRDERKSARLVDAFRRFNLRSKKGPCAMRGSTLRMVPKGTRGHAEQWRASLNTCSAPWRSFAIEVNNPNTGLITCATSGKDMAVDQLVGKSMDRTFHSLNFRVGFEFCSWKKSLGSQLGNSKDLVRIHTDPKMRSVLKPIQDTITKRGSTKNYTLQFIRPGFRATLRKGRYSESNFSQGKFSRRGAKGTITAHGATQEDWMVIGREN